MKEKFLNFLRSEILSSVLFLIFGLLLCLFPAESIHLTCRIILSLILILTGCYHIFEYLGERKTATVLDMFTGVLVLVLGMFLFQNPQIVVKLLPLLFGSMVLVDSIWVFRRARTLRNNNLEEWKAFLFGSFLCFILSLAVMWNPFSRITQTVIFCGIVFLVNGIADLVFILLFRRKMKELENPAQQEETQEMPKTTETSNEFYEEYKPTYSMTPPLEPVEEVDVTIDPPSAPQQPQKKGLPLFPLNRHQDSESQIVDPQTVDPQLTDSEAYDPQTIDPEAVDPQAVDPQTDNPHPTVHLEDPVESDSSFGAKARSFIFSNWEAKEEKQEDWK